MNDLHVFEVDDGEQWWYAAPNADAALRMHLEPLCGKDLPDDLSMLTEDQLCHLDCEIDEIEVRELPDDEMLRVSEDGGEAVEKTALEWVEDGAGFIAGTVW